MDDIVGNIFYLIPIALMIALRVINGKNKQARNQQRKPPAGDLARKTPEPRTNPEYSKQSAEAREVYTPPAAPRAKPASSTKPVAVKKPAKPAIKPVPKVIKGAKKPVPSDVVSASYENVPVQSAAVSDRDIRTVPAAQNAVSAALRNLQAGISGLPPLQQAVVWSEILGQPKGML